MRIGSTVAALALLMMTVACGSEFSSGETEVASSEFYPPSDPSNEGDWVLVSETNITLAIRAYVAAGFCFTVLPDFLARDDLKEGRLTRLLPDWSLRSGGIFAVTPPNRVRSNALQRFLYTANDELIA